MGPNPWEYELLDATMTQKWVPGENADSRGTESSRNH